MTPNPEPNNIKPFVVDANNEEHFSLFDIDFDPNSSSSEISKQNRNEGSVEEGVQVTKKFVDLRSSFTLASPRFKKIDFEGSSCAPSRSEQSSLDGDEELSLMSITVSSSEGRRSRRSSMNSRTSTGGSSFKSRRSKRVRFHSRIKVRAIPHIRTFFKKDISDLWYREAELKEIKKEVNDKIQTATPGDVVGHDDENNTADRQSNGCHRGLLASSTAHTTSNPTEASGLTGSVGPHRRRSNWIMALSCVLDEQEKQKRKGVHNPDQLARMYRSFTVPSLQIAQATARGNAKEAWKGRV